MTNAKAELAEVREQIELHEGVRFTDVGGMVFSDEKSGASDFSACLHRHGSICKCVPRCVICGHGEHAAIHGPSCSSKPGDAPFGHRFRGEQ